MTDNLQYSKQLFKYWPWVNRSSLTIHPQQETGLLHGLTMCLWCNKVAVWWWWRYAPNKQRRTISKESKWLTKQTEITWTKSTIHALKAFLRGPGTLMRLADIMIVALEIIKSKNKLMPNEYERLTLENKAYKKISLK